MCVWEMKAGGGRGVNAKKGVVRSVVNSVEKVHLGCNSFNERVVGSCVGKSGEPLVKGGVSKLGFQCNESIGRSVVKNNDRLASLEDVESKKTYGKSIRVFGSNDVLSGGVAFERGKGLLRSGLSLMGGDLGGPAIKLYNDLGGLEPFFEMGRMKTRNGARGCNFSGVEEELADRIAIGKEDDKG
ncbi:hypothetical protein LWI29_001467 [Acer saccharum]|uniref:Uncharacterized protein n=1 Tax=Acer saccharum TaxID=4024 RepID=A0AA39S230_ACESA|nr:hypothetical protein LWI29_001467 [Acer saccharum]